MIVRHTHWGWIAFCTVAALICVAVWWMGPRHNPEGITGGSTFGLWCGVLGSLCMIFAGILPLLRRRAVVLNSRLPPREWWLRGHLWLGLLSVVFIGFHSGFRLGGALVAALTIVYLIVIVSGILGLVVQSILPHRMTVSFHQEIPPGQVEAVCTAWRKECDALVDELCGPRPAFAANVHEERSNSDPLRRFYEEQMRPGLREMLPIRWPLRSEKRIRQAFEQLRSQISSPDRSKAASILGRLETVCLERLDLARQQSRFFWLHGWLPIHIGLSAALLVLGIVHVFTALMY
ncbi:MAG: hypothetical protein NZM31_01135 [Gemmatales bacterium]|nr:hypothetical protein [Gemmatales bacterium]MDW8385599.1 hypothetical protein [Gemmatales bacterium]